MHITYTDCVKKTWKPWNLFQFQSTKCKDNNKCTGTNWNIYKLRNIASIKNKYNGKITNKKYFNIDDRYKTFQ